MAKHRETTGNRTAWSLRELALAAGVCQPTLRAEIRDGNLRASRIRRRVIVREADWLEYLERKRA